MSTIFTIGHSDRTVEALAELLQASRVSLLVDVRSFPRSRTNPQFNTEVLGAALQPWQIGYVAIPALGGRRGRIKDEQPSPNGWWQVAAFRNYADYALTPSFAAGLAELRQLAAQQRVAIMCSEAVWWRCHRRIITDYLLAAGDTVCHILGPGHVDPAEMTEGAVVQPDGRIFYPAPVPAA